MACDPSIVGTRTRPDNIESGETDMISFKVVYNLPGKMVSEIAGSGDPWGYMVGCNRYRCNRNFPR